MRLFAITPLHVDGNELRRRQARYDRLSPAPLQVVLHDLGGDAPTSLDTVEDIRRSEELVNRAFSGVDPKDYVAAFPDCVLDPAVETLDGRVAVPVFGLLRLASAFLAGSGRRFGAVTRNRPIAEELKDRIDAYGLHNLFTRVEVLDLTVDAISDDDAWDDRLGRAVARLAADGAESILNGCSAVDLRAVPHGVPVVDPTQLALSMLAIGLKTNSLPGRRTSASAVGQR